MKSVWAPWRISYITGEKKNGCIFCITVRENKDRENLILYRGETGFIILNRYPYTNGHLMTVPYRHTSRLEDLNETERLELTNLTIKSIEVLKIIRPDGYNIGMNIGKVAGAGIEDHLHFHIVPRWNGDTNFMPVIGDVKVMPEYLDETYRVLHRELKIIEGDRK